MAYPLESAAYMMLEEKVDPLEYEEVFPLETIDVYFVFSKSFPDEEIAFYQERLDQILGTDAVKALRTKYAVDSIQHYQP